MVLTNSLVTVSSALQNKLLDNKANIGLMDVYFGDQNNIPTTPVACIEPINKVNNLRQSAAARMIDIEFNVQILLYTATVQSTQMNRIDSDMFAELIEAVIHSDRTLGGLVIHGYCTEVQSGYTTKATSILRSNRITYYATSQIVLPS